MKKCLSMIGILIVVSVFSLVIYLKMEHRQPEREKILGIICWGDSLTAGTGGDGTTYPAVLQQLIQDNLIPETLSDSFEVEVLNMGVGGEDTNTILGRNGAIPFVVAENLVIPARAEPVEIRFQSAAGKAVAPLRQGTAGIEWVEMNGVSGELNIDQESYTSSEYSYTFTRKDVGDPIEIPAGTPILTSGSVVGTDYFTVIFMGENGGYDTYGELIAQQRAIIEHQEKNKDCFIIIGLHTGTAKERADLEATMKAEYGDKYINLREYMCTEGLRDAGLLPTSEDEEMMEKGMTPASLMISDKCHFNEYGYKLIGNLIYNRMDELGYFDEMKNTLRIREGNTYDPKDKKAETGYFIR